MRFSSFHLALSLTLFSCVSPEPPSPADDVRGETGDALDDTRDAPFDGAIDVNDTVEDIAPPDAEPPEVVDTPPPPDSAPSRPVPTCPDGWAPPEVILDLAFAPLQEVSGIVASHTQNDLLWMHNDSGDAARLYPIFLDGSAGTPLDLLDIDAVDFEDIARSACPDGEGECLWIADIGNNLLTREVLKIHLLREVWVDPEGASPTSAEALATFSFSYPGGPVDAEALLVAPDGSAFWIVEKSASPTARVFGSPVPLDEGSVLTLDIVAELNSPGLDVMGGMGWMITGADMHPSGTRVALRTYTGSFEYVLPEAVALETLGEVEPIPVAWGPLPEPQGEAIAYATSGDALWTASEMEGLPDAPFQPLHLYSCAQGSD